MSLSTELDEDTSATAVEPSLRPNAVVSLTRPSDIPKLAVWLKQVQQQQQAETADADAASDNGAITSNNILHMEELIIRGIEIDDGVSSLLMKLTNLNTNPNGWHSMEILNCESVRAAGVEEVVDDDNDANNTATRGRGGVHTAICHAIRTNQVHHLSLVNVEMDHLGYVELGQAILDSTTFSSPSSLQSLRLTTPLLVTEDVQALINNGIAKANNESLSLRVLDFKGTTFDTSSTAMARYGTTSIYELAKGLRSNKSLEELKFYGCNLDDTEMSIIVHSLRYHPNLRHLDFNGNSCGKQTSKALFDMLVAVSCQLSKLDLSCQRTTTPPMTNDNHHQQQVGADSGLDIVLLSQALQQNRCLQVLDLSSNRDLIQTSQQLQTLGVSLTINTTLKELYLSRNKICSSNIKDLAKTYLPRMYGLKRLSLWGNELTESNVSILYNSLKHYNTTLEQLDLFQSFACSKQIQHLLCLNRGGRRIYYDHNHSHQKHDDGQQQVNNDEKEASSSTRIVDPNTIPNSLWPHVMARVNRIRMVKGSTANSTSSFLSSYNTGGGGGSGSSGMMNSITSAKDQKAKLNALFYFVRESPAILCHQ